MTKHRLNDESISLTHGDVKEFIMKPKTLRLFALSIELCQFDQVDHGFCNW